MNIDWNNLTSGLLGAIFGSIIGAIASYKAAIRGAQISIKETAKLDIERRKQNEKQLKGQILRFVNEELESNLALAQNIRISHAKIRFNSQAFEMAKLNAQILPDEFILLILPVYIEVIRFNTLANYDQEKVSWGGGYLDDALEKQAVEIKNKINEVLPKVERCIKDA